MSIETIYKRFSECRRNRDHRSCTGAYLGTAKDEKTGEVYEVRYQCNCAHHRNGMIDSIQRGFFEREPEESRPAFHRWDQQSLFNRKP